MKRLMLYVIPLSAMAVLVFAAIAVAQSVPEDQAHSHDANEQAAVPAETTTPAETNTPTSNSTTMVNGAIVVDIRNLAFDPAQLNVAPGTTVKFVNNDPEWHTATADNELFDTGALEAGESFEVYFEGAGTVTYHCELHPDMKGSIVVGEGGAGEGTTPQDQAAEEAPNEPSSDAAQPVTEAAQPNRGY